MKIKQSILAVPAERNRRVVCPDCLSCQHFHGKEYFGIPLNCAFHLEGWINWRDAECPNFSELKKDE